MGEEGGANSAAMTNVMAPASPVPACLAWRHPKPIGAQGRCIGGASDLPIDRRKAKRLAHRIRREARRHGWPRIVHTSPSRRCALVGRILRGWGWRHRVHAGLLEMDFGRWDGMPWSAIPQAEIDAWCADFLHHKPGGTASLNDMLQQVRQWWAMPLGPGAQGVAQSSTASSSPMLVVGHGGWMLSARWLATRTSPPERADQWPTPPAYGQCWALSPPQRPLQPGPP
jgi:alpha-ribazole phosphatase